MSCSATLAAERARPSADAERRVRTLPPAAVVAEVTRRLRRLSPPAVELARAVAILDGEAELRHAVALAGLPMATGEAAADELTLARLLAPARPLRFAHPILHAAVEAELRAGAAGGGTPARRRRCWTPSRTWPIGPPLTCCGASRRATPG